MDVRGSRHARKMGAPIFHRPRTAASATQSGFSPIEEKMITALCADLSRLPGFVLLDEGHCLAEIVQEMADLDAMGMTPLIIAPWVKVESYVIDIVLAVPGPAGDVVLAIECDGHDFHERTKEQAARDKSRDRALTALDVRVIRFTGAEIWHRTAECSEEVRSIMGGILDVQANAANHKIFSRGRQ